MKNNFFIKLQFQSVEYSVYVALEILIHVIGIILRFGNWSLKHLYAPENSSTCNWNSVTVTQFNDNFIKVLLPRNCSRWFKIFTSRFYGLYIDLQLKNWKIYENEEFFN